MDGGNGVKTIVYNTKKEKKGGHTQKREKKEKKRKRKRKREQRVEEIQQ